MSTKDHAVLTSRMQKSLVEDMADGPLAENYEIPTLQTTTQGCSTGDQALATYLCICTC